MLLKILPLALHTNPDTDRTENASSIIACPLVAGETTSPQSCFLATTVLLQPVYIAVTWQWVYISQYRELEFYPLLCMGVQLGPSP
jgi:hypothetical protein